jgi:hypothetical protein
VTQTPYGVRGDAEERIIVQAQIDSAFASIDPSPAPIRSDAAPDEGTVEGPGAPDGCPAVEARWTLPAASCAIADDPAGDAGSSLLPGETPSLDIRSLPFGATAEALTIDIGVAALGAPPPQVDAQEYTAFFTLDTPEAERTVSLFAQRSDAGFSFSYGMRPAFGSTAGRFDVGSSTIRIMVPRAVLAVPDGTKVTGLRASTYRARGGGILLDEHDTAPDRTRETADFVLAPECGAAEVLQCPVVLDAESDSGLVGIDDLLVPEPEPALDLLRAGASTVEGTIRLSARLASLGSLPPGARSVAVVVSWYAGGSQRWVGQAVRAADGTTSFTYGRTGGSETFPGSRISDGTPTTGTADLATGVVRIDIPRAAVGSPPDGAVLPSLGASTSAENVTGPFVETGGDVTRVRAYLVGTDCGF